MELLSSSDEDDSVTSYRPPAPRPIRASPARSAAATDDDFMSELLSATESTPSINSEAGKPTASSSSLSGAHTDRHSGGGDDSGAAAWRRLGEAPASGSKPVISARELLLRLMPRGKAREEFASPPKAKATSTTTGAASAPRIDAQQEPPPAPALSPSQLIALKYGLRPSGASSEPPVSGSGSTKPQAPRSTVQQQRTAPAAPERRTDVDRKRSFWAAQAAGADKAAAAKSAYVSPFRSPDALEAMQRRRRSLGALEPRRLTDEALPRLDRRCSTDSIGIPAEDDEDAAPRRDSKSRGAAVTERVVDDDIWFSDASEGTPDADTSAQAPRQEVEEEDEATTTADSALVTTVLSGRRLSTPRLQARVIRKRRRQHEEPQLKSSDSYDERWPKLAPPPRDEGPMVLPTVEDSSAVPLSVCANINSYLFDYQREGVQFIGRAYQDNTGAILGDEMGLGKTIQVIALLSAILKKTGRAEDKMAWKQLRSARRERYEELNGEASRGDLMCGGAAPILVVVPASLLHNWESELHEWMCCSTIILHGKTSERESLLDQIERGEYELVICSYDILKICNERLHAIPWELVILDEMHCLKNPESQLTKAVKAIKCRKKIGLTGTLMQNNEKELHCLVDTIAPGVLGSWQEFRIYYGDDIKYGRKKSAAPEALERSRVKEKKLRQKLVAYYLRREKEINSQFQVVKKCDQVVFCDLTPLQMAAYKRILAMPEFELLRKGEEPCDCGRDSKRKRKVCCYRTPMDMGIPASEAVIWNKFHVGGQACRSCPNCMGLVCVAQLLKLSNHMELLKVNPRDPPEIQAYAATFASQAFGEDRDAVGGIQQVTTFQETRALGTSTCGKMLVLEKLLALWQKRRQKTLLFSRSTRMLDILQLFLISKAISYSRLDGNTKVDERLELVNAFNRSDSNVSVFLISTKAGGVGLNLPSATNVVIFDPSWNPAHDCQAQDRAYRIGQTKDVQVYRLITLGTIEEMIYVRQIYKQQLSDTTLKGAKAPRYFEGVQGDPRQQGELFGIRNLLCWKEGGVLKGIQDAYKRDSDGLLLQTNQFQYEQLHAKKRPKKKPVKAADESEEMVEVADELVADMLSPAPSTTTAEGTTPTRPNTAVDSDQAGSDDEDLLLPGATTAMHEAIVGEQLNSADSSLSDTDSAFDDPDGATGEQAEPENEERTAKKTRSELPLRGADGDAASGGESDGSVKLVVVRPAPHPTLVKKLAEAASSAAGPPKPRKGLRPILTPTALSLFTTRASCVSSCIDMTETTSLLAADQRHSYIQRQQSLPGPGAYSIPSTFRRSAANTLLRAVQRDHYGREFARMKRNAATSSPEVDATAGAAPLSTVVSAIAIPAGGDGDSAFAVDDARPKADANSTVGCVGSEIPAGQPGGVTPDTYRTLKRSCLCGSEGPCGPTPPIGLMSCYDAFVDGYVPMPATANGDDKPSRSPLKARELSLSPPPPPTRQLSRDGVARGPRRRSNDNKLVGLFRDPPRGGPPGSAAAAPSYERYLASTSYLKRLTRHRQRCHGDAVD